ncbi:MAG: C40 family peptidase [Candidatus Rokuibacteriota bacterium]
MFWVPAWRMYLREGDVVAHAGRDYALHEGRWYVVDATRNEWVPVDALQAETSGTETAPRLPAATARPERSAIAAITPEAGAGTRPRTAVVRVALRHVGVPYMWGGSSPAGFDCSGLVQYAYRQLGVALPRTVAEQYRVGTPVAPAHMQPGDIVFFDKLRHNGIYLGDGEFVHSSKTGDVVRISRLDETWFRQRWMGARRP